MAGKTGKSKSQGKPKLTPIQRLATAPRQPERTIVGTLRQLDEPVELEGEVLEPAIALWLDAHTGETWGMVVFDPEENDEDNYAIAVQALVEGLLKGPEQAVSEFEHLLPDPGGKARGPLVPGRILVDDPSLAEAVRRQLATLAIRVEDAPEVELLDEAFDALLEALGISDEEGEPYRWDLDPAILVPLFQAANDFWRQEPWNLVSDETPIAIELGDRGPEDGVTTLHAAILGKTGVVIGAALYYSLDDFRAAREEGRNITHFTDEDIEEATVMMARTGIDPALIPHHLLRPMLEELAAEQQGAAGIFEGNALICAFDDVEETSPAYIDWLDEHDLAGPNDEVVPLFMRVVPGSEPREVTLREARAARVALAALQGAFAEQRALLQADHDATSPIVATVPVDGSPVTVTFTAPLQIEGDLVEIDGDDLEDDDLIEDE